MQTIERDIGTKKVGGWLLLMCNLLMYVGPAISILGTFAKFTELDRQGMLLPLNFGTYKVLSWVIVVIYVTLSAMAGHQLKNELTPETIPKVKQIIWTIFVGGTVMNVFVLPHFFLGLTVDQVVSGVLLTIFSIFVAWSYTQYLSKSKRVRDTYIASVPDSETPPTKGERAQPDYPAQEPHVHTTVVQVQQKQNVAVIPDDEQLWAQAIGEFEGDSRRVGLWAKAFAQADGNELQAKAQYLKQRVTELKAVPIGETDAHYKT